MTPLLRQALEAAGRMSPEEQDALALVILDELDGERWTDCLGALVEAEAEPRLPDLDAESVPARPHYGGWTAWEPDAPSSL